MADFEYVPCPQCGDKLMVHEEFFVIPEAYCHCPMCGAEFKVSYDARGRVPVAIPLQGGAAEREV